MTEPRRATIADVARTAGVSTSTASLVFSGKAPVSEATREKVLTAATSLDYSGPDPRAASLRTGRSGIVAVVIPGSVRRTFVDHVALATMDGLTDALADVDAGLLLLRDDPASDDAASLGTTPIDAAVLFACSPRLADSLTAVRTRQLPLVVIEGDAGEGIPQITLDNTQAAADVARHVHELGHRDVAVLTLPLDEERARGPVSAERLARATVLPAIERVNGIREVFPDARLCSAATTTIDEGVRLGREMLAAPSRPTAILAQSDLLAAGVIHAAGEYGLRVPEDLSVTGFDGVRVDGIGSHVLTTSVQPAVDKGRAAGEQIVAMLNGKEGQSVHLHCIFRAGTTTGPPSSR